MTQEVCWPGKPVVTGPWVGDEPLALVSEFPDLGVAPSFQTLLTTEGVAHDQNEEHGSDNVRRSRYVGSRLLFSNGIGAAADAEKPTPSDASTDAARDAAQDMTRDTARDAKRDVARDASRQESPQQAANILKQTYAQLLMREVKDAERASYGSPLMRGEKSVREIVGVIARSPEFKDKWITPAMGATISAASTQKAVDNIYCAILGRHSTSVANGHEGVAGGGFEELITDILDGKEYGTKFGEQGVPQPILTQGESDGCPQVS
jgi:phycobilisome linker polypeptide